MSPGYARAITWLSEIWAAFDRTILAWSFDQYGITSANLDDMHLQLRTFVNSAQFLDTVVDAPTNEDMEKLFTPPREGDLLDESFRDDELMAESGEDDEAENENEA